MLSNVFIEHPWIRGGEASDNPIDSAALSLMRQFRAMSKLKKLAPKIIAESLSEEEIKGLKTMFALDRYISQGRCIDTDWIKMRNLFKAVQHIDKDNSRFITMDELRVSHEREYWHYGR
ncbi:hypothetical protein HID58_012452 [Brassica napus]|uniref:EF-hand domain-containing protein n=1 Tax=Brassica napus TaxID=3708 RepID=A0ABQ8E3P4_BRANA|nr:hypothetical protein HID58_012452 [Brassica napus]